MQQRDVVKQAQLELDDDDMLRLSPPSVLEIEFVSLHFRAKKRWYFPKMVLPKDVVVFAEGVVI